MPEYILYDKEGKKRILAHMIDVRTALDTGLYSAERPEPKEKESVTVKLKKSNKSKFNIAEVETEKTPAEEMQDKVKTKSDINKMEDKIKKEKKL